MTLPKSPHPRIGSSMALGVSAAAVFVGGFGIWAAVAPISSAVVSSGYIKVFGERKVIQHLEGGIVAEVVAHNGDLVEAGGVLLRLDDTAVRANRDLLAGRWLSRIALAARLAGERDGAEAIVFPAELVGSTDPAAEQAMRVQESVFMARRQALAGERSILGQRIAQTRDEIRGIEELLSATEVQLGLVRQEAGDLDGLLKQQLITQARYLELKRREAELVGKAAESRAAISRARKAIAEIEQQIIELDVRQLNEAVNQLSEVEVQLSDLDQQMRTANDVLARLRVVAPVAGIVVASRVHSTGAVIREGDSLMEIVPAGDALVVEAQVRPEEVDDIRVGQIAQIWVGSFDRRHLPSLEGVVEMVSADRLMDERTGAPYYNAVITISRDELKKLGERELVPGMPAETVIATGERTLLQYLTAPLTRSFRRALREG